jgi:hypothetical protein
MNNDFDAFELLKHSSQTNFHEDLHRVPLVSYGVVRDVVSISSVIVDTVVQNQQAQETYSVPLLYPSSALFEHSVYPKRGDLVLLLFVQRFNAAMFDDPLVREQLTGSMALYDADAAGYTRFSGVGLLMRTPKNNSDITVQHGETAENESAVTASVKAALTLMLGRNVSILVDKHPSEAGAGITASVIYGERAVYEEAHHHDTKRSYGVREAVDGALQELSAPVTEVYSMYAPITRNVQGAETLDRGLGTDKDGHLVETDAPFVETVHGKAPVTRDIRSPQSITIGIGNAESGSTEADRDAPVTVTLGGKADIALTSKSGLTAHFDKALSMSGNAAVLTLNDKVYIGNATSDLCTVLTGLVDKIAALTVVGQASVSPEWTVEMQGYKTQIQSVLSTPDAAG